jgi:hypothetical protein
MKARVLFYCAAVVALVLFLAAVPSHATERRDPFVVQEATQVPAAKPTSSAHVTSTHKKPAPKHTQKQNGASANAEKKNTAASGQNAGGVHDNSGSSSAAK